MSRWTPFILKALIVVLVLAVLGTGIAIARYMLLNDDLSAPRTEAERALFLAIQSVKANPNDAQARIKLAAAYLELGRVNNAVKEAKVAARLAPDNGQAHFVLGLAQKEQNNLKEAIKSFEKAANSKGQLAPFYQNCWLEAAQANMDLKDYKKAVKAYEKALDFGPESSPILYSLGVAYEKSGDKVTALAYYEEALEYTPDYKEAVDAAKRLIKQGVTTDSKNTANNAEGNNAPAKNTDK